MNNIVIYGAGKYAKVLYERYVFLEIDNRIAYFIVSEKLGNEEIIGDKYIYPLEEKASDLADKDIIVAVSPKNMPDIMNRLSRIKYSSLLQFSIYGQENNDQTFINLVRGLEIKHRKLFFILEKYEDIKTYDFVIEIAIRNKYEWNICIVDDSNIDVNENYASNCIGFNSIHYFKELYTSGVVFSNVDINFIKRAEQYFIRDYPLGTSNDIDAEFTLTEKDLADYSCSIKNYDIEGHNDFCNYIISIMDDTQKYGKTVRYAWNCEDDRFSLELKIPKVSVIVPVYNVQPYLKKCLDSILLQTLDDIEIICIDDGSTDESPQILDEYAENDSRIRVLHRENRGYGSTMNVGVAEARGEYIGIVESDDSIMRNMYEMLYKKAHWYDLDFIKAQSYFCWDNIQFRIFYSAYKMDEYFNCVLTQDDFEVLCRFRMNTWSGIYRKSFLIENNIIHHESPGASFQDNGFWIQTLIWAKRCMWIKNPLYLYNQDNENASIRSNKMVYAMSNEYDWIEERLRRRGTSKDKLKIIQFYRLLRNKGNFFRISDDLKQDFLRQIIDDYKKYGDALEDKDEKLNLWYKLLVDKRQDYCKGVIDKKNSIVSAISNASRIYIYATLPTSLKVRRILYVNKLDQKLSAFIQIAPVERCRIGNIPVYSVYDPEVDLNEALIIIGTPKTSDLYEGIINSLEKMGGRKIIDCEEIEENFYWIV